MDPRDYADMVEDLSIMRSAIEKSSGIFRFLRLSRVMGLVGLFSGLGIIAFVGVWYYFDRRFGGLAEAPRVVRGFFIGFGVALLIGVAIGKILAIMEQARKTYHDLTVLRLINEVDTARTASIIVPCALAPGGLC